MRFAHGSKYRSVKTSVDGIEFDSKAEANRYQELKLRVRAGEIHTLERQVRYDLVVNGVKCGFYKADFRYVVRDTGETIVEDVKGFRTAVFALKAKLVRALYGVSIYEVGHNKYQRAKRSAAK